ncbi:MAG TPA: histidine kinase [Acidimicrobiales bacterium]|nr:histidine kinase [Acidimicrobiales bacterium]
MSTPIIVSQLGEVRESARVQARQESALRTASAHPLAVVASIVLAVVAVATGASAPIVDPHGDMALLVVRATVVVLFALAGLFALLRRPEERQPLTVLEGAALGGLITQAAALLDARAHGAATVSGLLSVAHLVEPVALALLPIAAMHVLLGIPDGSCRLSRIVVAGGYLVGLALGFALWAGRPGAPLWPTGVEAALAVLIGGGVSKRRYSLARGLERQRMQWFGWATAVGLASLLVALALHALLDWPTRAALVATVALTPFAAAVAMSSTRRLASRVDRILTHTVSLAGLSGVVAAVYLVIVAGLGNTPSRSDRALLVLSMVSAAVSALLYGPARHRLSLYANRLVYGAREAPDTILRTFGSRLSRAIPMDELLLQVAESLRKTLSLSSAEVWTGSEGHLQRAISVPEIPPISLHLSPEEESVVARAGVTGTAWLSVWLPGLVAGREGSLLRVAPTIHSGRVLGLIVAERPADGDQFTADDDAVLTELARQVGLALHNVELDSALQKTLEELRRQAEQLQESRARIVAASDAARRQIERNLHDGAQQHLVALAVNVRLARRLAETDPAASIEILDELGEGLRNAVQELRALAHGIYPPLLADRGIEEALQSAATRAALPTAVETSGLGRYPPEVEAAVYFCCLEALQNAGKHAGEGASASVKVWEEPGALLFEVKDDGVGFDAGANGAKGAGFVNMGDRLGAMGGALRVGSARGQGTTLSGRVPLTAQKELVS